MQVKIIAERKHSAILSTCIKLISVFKNFVGFFSILEWCGFFLFLSGR